MVKIILIIISIFFLSCKTPQKIGEIKKIYVFDSFKERGYTTAGAYTHFNDMVEKKINKTEISFEDCKQFNLILKNIKPKNHLQTKFGGGLIFVEAMIGQKLTRIIIASDDLIVDLTNNCNYKLNDRTDKEWLSAFLNKKHSQSEH